MNEGALEGVLERVRSGDQEAFAELYRRFGRRVLGLCRHLLGGGGAAEDATSEVFLRVQKAMGSYDRAIPFPRWLLSIASHYCIDQLRRRRVERRLFESGEADSEGPAAPGPSPLAEILAEEQRAEVRAALEALPERYRLPLILRYYSEMSYEEISAELGLHRNHVATLLFRGKQELRQALRTRTQNKG